MGKNTTANMIASIVLVLTLGILACKPERAALPPPSPGPGPEPDKKNTAENPVIEEPGVDQEAKQKIDGSKLKIYGLRVVKQSNGFSTGLNISYEPDGKAEYIEIQICPLVHGEPCISDGVCEAGKKCEQLVSPHNRYRLGLLYEGETLYKVRACVPLENALGIVGCGPWAKKMYNSNIFNREESALLRDAIRIKHNLGELGLLYRSALETFEREASACTSLNAEAKKFMDSKLRVVGQFLKAPAQWFKSSAEIAADAVLSPIGAESKDVLGSVGRLQDSINDHFARSCEKIGENTSDTICEILKQGTMFAKGMLQVLNPTAPVGTLSNSLHDIIHGSFKGDRDKLVAKACYAEKNLQQRLKDINRELDSYQRELTGIKANLKNLAGHRVKIPK